MCDNIAFLTMYVYHDRFRYTDLHYIYNTYRVALKRPGCRSAVLPSSSATITAIASYSHGCVTAAWTAPTDLTNRRTDATTPLVGPTSSVVGTTRAFPGSSIVLVLQTAPTVAMKKIAVSPLHVIIYYNI